MATILAKMGLLTSPSPGASPAAKVVFTNYKSLPVELPDDFLAPLPDPSTISVKLIDFASTTLPEYRKLYAVVLDNVLSQEECNTLIQLAEESTGAHKSDDSGPEDNGWKPAMVNAGRNKGVLATDYRNSDRIIWDQQDVASRILKRVMQVESVKNYLEVLDGERYYPVLGDGAMRRGERWMLAERGLNEAMKFLRYGPGQFFREHCDGTYETEDGSERSFYTLHLYLNDSVAGLSPDTENDLIGLDTEPKPLGDSEEMLVGGATTFHSKNLQYRLDVHPKAGRILIFQQKRLLHSGDDVFSGVKYTMRSDLMYRFEMDEDEDGGIVFG